MIFSIFKKYVEKNNKQSRVFSLNSFEILSRKPSLTKLECFVQLRVKDFIIFKFVQVFGQIPSNSNEIVFLNEN